MSGTKPEYLKAVVWPRGKTITQAGEAHSYIITGLLVTEEPIPELEGNEFVLDGTTYGLSDILALIHKRDPNQKTGDANNVLTSLNDL